MELVWIGLPFARIVHDEQLAEHGGRAGIRDSGALESALARPRNLPAYSKRQPTIAQLAAIYGTEIAKNHPFIDGNKRTALVVCLSFLELNGVAITAEPHDRYLMFEGLASGRVSEEDFATWLQNSCVPVKMPPQGTE